MIAIMMPILECRGRYHQVSDLSKQPGRHASGAGVHGFSFGIPAFRVPVFGIPYFGIPWLGESPTVGFPYLRNPCPLNPCFLNSLCRIPCFWNSHLRNFSRIQAPLNQTPLRPPPKFWSACLLLVIAGTMAKDNPLPNPNQQQLLSGPFILLFAPFCDLNTPFPEINHSGPLHCPILESCVENCLHWGQSNLFDPAEWPKIGLLNPHFVDFPRRVPPCAVKTCAERPVFARAWGELRAADRSDVQGPVKQKASPGE